MRRAALAAVVLALALAPVAGATSVADAVDADGIDTAGALDRSPAVSSPSGTVPAVSTTLDRTTLELQAAESDDTDKGTLTYTFTVDGNESDSTSVDISPSSASRDGGAVTFQFDRWEDLDGGGSGTSTSFTATGGHRYRVVYEVTAESGAGEGQYSITSSADTGNGNTYSEQLEATVDVLSPQFGAVGRQTTTVVFDADSGRTADTGVGVDVPNDGDGVLVPESVSYSGVPAGISVETATLPDEIPAGGDGRVDVAIDVSESVPEGTEEFTATVEDNLGNTEQFDVAVEVSKPPAVSVSDADGGDILRGRSASVTVDVAEVAGYDSIDGLDVDVVRTDPNGQLDVSDLRSTAVGADGSTTAQIDISVAEDAPQGASLDWELAVTPQAANAETETVDVSAAVIYPPYYDGVSMPDTELVFDEPRSSADQFAQTVDVAVTNGGDLPMQLEEASATAEGTEITATVADVPSSIPAQSTRSVTLEVSADASTAEVSRTVEVSLSAAQAGDTSTSATVAVVHDTELTLSTETVDFGRLPPAQGYSSAVELTERLGYNDVRELEITRISGPDEGWLSTPTRPDSLAAGESRTLVFSLRFDTSAEFYEQYRWRYRVGGANVEDRTVTVSAIPILRLTNRTADQLSTYEDADGSLGEIPGPMNDALTQLQQDLLEDRGIDDADIRSVNIAGRTAVLFLNASADAKAAIEAGDHDRAQRYVVRAAVAYDTLRLYGGEIADPALRRDVSTSTQAAGEALDTLVATQTDYYESRLDAENTTMLERANIQRELARLAALQGDTGRADRLRAESRSAFEEYLSLVSRGNENLQQARTRREALDRSLFVSVAGQRVFWIGSLDRYESDTDRVLAAYDRAIEQFREAGAVERARATRAERQRLAASYEFARTAALALGVLAGLAFLLVLGYELRGVYRYVRDSRASVSGDFLVG